MAIQTVKTGAAVNDGTGDDARTAFTKINQNFTDGANAASRQVGTAAGNVMEVGAFGLGGISRTVNKSGTDALQTNGFYHDLGGDGGNMGYCAFLNVMHSEDIKFAWQIGVPMGHTNLTSLQARVKSGGIWSSVAKIWNEHNTTKDSNGFLKGASPVVQLFANKIELNEEAKLQDITFAKLGVGDYLVKGSTGFAQEGWYIETPKDANGNVLVAVVYEQLANNDISVKTYDYMLNKKGRIVPDLETPLDIPATRWIDLRLQALPQSDIKPFNNYETAILDA